MGFSRQAHWSGLPCPPPEDLSDPGIEPSPLTFPALAGMFFTTSATWEAHLGHTKNKNQWETRQKLNIKMYKNLNGCFTKENIQIANNYERGLTYLVIMKIHIKIVLGIPLDIH